MTRHIDLRVRQLELDNCRGREGIWLLNGIAAALMWLGVLWLLGAFQ